MSRAEELMANADKKLKEWNWFMGPKYEDAIDLYTKAAAQFKISEDWDRATQAYIKAAELCEKTNDSSGACSNYLEAAKAAKNVSAKDAINYYKITITKHMEGNRFSTAAKLWKEVAAIEEKQGDVKSAVQAWSEAAKCFKAEDQSTSENQALLKVADLAVEHMKDYKQGIQIYEQVAKVSADSQLGRHSVKDYLFKAGLCHFALGAQSGTLDGVGKMFENYKDRYSTFDGSRECKLLESLLEAYQQNDEGTFTGHLKKYNNISPLDDWVSKILYDIKLTLQEGPADGGEDDAT